MQLFYRRNEPAAMNNELTVSRSAGLSLAGERAHLGVEFTFRFGAALSWVLHKLAVRGQGAVVRTPKNQRECCAPQSFVSNASRLESSQSNCFPVIDDLILLHSK